MKAVRVDKQLVRLAIEMTPDEANDLRNMLMEAAKNADVCPGDFNRMLLKSIIDAIGKVY